MTDRNGGKAFRKCLLIGCVDNNGLLLFSSLGQWGILVVLWNVGRASSMVVVVVLVLVF